MNQQKKIALVTGASRGIGKEIAVTLSQNGYLVICCGRNQAADNFPSELIWRKVDVSRASQVGELCKYIESNIGVVFFGC